VENKTSSAKPKQFWISYSKLSTFKQCPLKYKFQYIDKLPTKPAPALFFGSTIHSCLEWLHRPEDAGDGNSGGRTLWDLLEYLDQVWSPPDEFDDDALAKAGCTRDRAEALLTEYYLKHVGHAGDAGRTNEPPRAHAVEKKFKIDFDGDVVNGIIDRIDRIVDEAGNVSYEIIDYKTNKKAPNRLYDEQLVQLAIYQWAAQEGKDWDNRALEFYPVNRAGLFFVVPEVNRKMFPERGLDVEAVKREVRQAIDSIKQATADQQAGKDAFCPTENKLCDWCDFQASCPARSAAS
jgi:RecB family exonuclease